MGVSSNRNTIHVFSIECSYKKTNGNKNLNISIPKNNTSLFYFLPKFISNGYFNSEWSFINITINEINSMIGFNEDNDLFVLTPSGQFYKIKLDLQNAGNYTVVEKEKIKE